LASATKYAESNFQKKKNKSVAMKWDCDKCEFVIIENDTSDPELLKLINDLKKEYLKIDICDPIKHKISRNCS